MEEELFNNILEKQLKIKTYRFFNKHSILWQWQWQQRKIDRIEGKYLSRNNFFSKKETQISLISTVIFNWILIITLKFTQIKAKEKLWFQCWIIFKCNFSILILINCVWMVEMQKPTRTYVYNINEAVSTSQALF